MKMESVKSSTIKAIGYDADAKMLRVMFHSGGAYDYKNVPEHVYLNLLQAPSVGKVFHSDVRGQYDHVKA